LNWGDAGLKAFFAKIRDSTRPGGTLILEPQPWSTYKKKRYLTHEIYSTYKTLQFKPADFVSFLTSGVQAWSDLRVRGA
jgi:7SK snRNA methylphosphate capping enzyme